MRIQYKGGLSATLSVKQSGVGNNLCQSKTGILLTKSQGFLTTSRNPKEQATSNWKDSLSYAAKLCTIQCTAKTVVKCTVTWPSPAGSGVLPPRGTWSRSPLPGDKWFSVMDIITTNPQIKGTSYFIRTHYTWRFTEIIVTKLNFNSFLPSLGFSFPSIPEFGTSPSRVFHT